MLIEKLKLTIKKLRHEQFGLSSERGALPDQLELQLADGDLKSEWWRDHLGMLGDIERNPRLTPGRRESSPGIGWKAIQFLLAQGLEPR
ncbi:transposase domain-containing protein [Bradyrhizobium ganzhouense]|uniref:transposase domain-containing protein n=1 Tax=Bradyrhizobium ganzhouense TaxID=1179767 RepID=UPI003CEE6DDB